MGTRASLYLLKDLDTNDSVPIIPSNNLLYNLCSFIQESVDLEKSIPH